MKPELERKQLLTNPHSPGKFRVLGSVANSEEFKEAFQCKAKAKLNPKDKCIMY